MILLVFFFELMYSCCFTACLNVILFVYYNLGNIFILFWYLR